MTKEKTNPFDFYNDACYGKTNLVKNGSEIKDYLPYLVNRAFSYHADTIFHANEMNIRPGADKLMQYEYYMHGIIKRKRYSGKWHRNEVTEDMSTIMEYYSVNREIAKRYLKILTKDQIKDIRSRLNRGGLKNK